MKEISILKNQIASSKDLSSVVKYFFELTEQNKIFKHSIQCDLKNMNDCSELKIAIHEAIKSVSEKLNQPVAILQYNFCKIEKENFYHGYCMLYMHAAPSLFIYAADLKMGIIVIANVLGEINYIRFSLKIMEGVETLH